MRRILLALLLAAAPAGAGEITALRTLPAGTVVSLSDLGVAEGADAAPFVGLEVVRAIYVGRPVRMQDLGPPTLVRRNAIVQMIYDRGVLSIRTEGRALDAGGQGERIRVMNLSSREPVSATVRGVGLVEVAR